MFVFTSAWSTMKRHKCRTLLIVLVTAAAVFSAVFTQALSTENTEAQHGSGYQLLQPTAVIRPTASKLAQRNGADPATTKGYLSYNEYSTYAAALQQFQIQPQFVFTESMPMRQSNSAKAIPGTADQSSDKTGGEFTLVGLFDAKGNNINHAGKIKVTKGKNLNFTKPSKSEALISQDVAKRSNLKVGSTFTVGDATDAKKTYTLNVTGIYTYTTAPLEGSTGSTKLAKDNRNNAIYVSGAFPKLSDDAILSGKSTGWGTPEFDIGFSLQSIDQYDSFVKAIKQVGLPKGYKVKSPTISEYKASIQPLRTLATRLNNGTNLVYITAGVLLLLLALWSLTGRRDEIGADLVIGNKRLHIGTQLMFELALPALLGLTIGGAAILLAIKPLGKALAGGHTILLVSDCWIPMWVTFAAIAILAVLAYLRAACARINTLFDKRNMGGTGAGSTEAVIASQPERNSTNDDAQVETTATGSDSDSRKDKETGR